MIFRFTYSLFEFAFVHLTIAKHATLTSFNDQLNSKSSTLEPRKIVEKFERNWQLNVWRCFRSIQNDFINLLFVFSMIVLCWFDWLMLKIYPQQSELDREENGWTMSGGRQKKSETEGTRKKKQKNKRTINRERSDSNRERWMMQIQLSFNK